MVVTNSPTAFLFMLCINLERKLALSMREFVTEGRKQFHVAPLKEIHVVLLLTLLATADAAPLFAQQSRSSVLKVCFEHIHCSHINNMADVRSKVLVRPTDIEPVTTVLIELPSETTQGIPKEVATNEIDEKYFCGNCRFILREPMQSKECGHRYCRECLDSILRSYEHTEVASDQPKCRMCSQEGDGEEVILSKENCFRDNSVLRDYKRIEARCLYNCGFTGSLYDYCKHEEKCRSAKVLCEMCDKPVRRYKMKSHLCQSVPCRIVGCDAKMKPSEMQRHEESSVRRHTRLLSEQIVILLAFLSNLKRSRDARNQDDETSNMAETQFEKRITPTVTTDPENKQTDIHRDHSSPQKPKTTDHLDFTEESRSRLCDLENKYCQAEDALAKIKRELLMLGRNIQATVVTVKKDFEELTRLNDLVQSLSEKVQGLARTLQSLRDRPSAAPTYPTLPTSYLGVLVWRIPDFMTKKVIAATGGEHCLVSPDFYSGEAGYRMACKLYPNGDGQGKNSHVSLFFFLKKGTFDPLLTWPFRLKITLMILDQAGSDHITDVFVPDAMSSSFQRPKREQNVASGSPCFLAHRSLEGGGTSTSNRRKYVGDDGSLFVKVTATRA